MASTSPLQWVFELFDKMSGPAKAMSESTEHLNDSLKHATSAHEKLGESQQHASQHSEGFRHQLFETVMIAQEVGNVMLEVGAKIAEFGSEMLKAAGGTEQIKVALNGMIGNKAEVNEYLERLEKFAPSTAFTGGEIRNFGADLVRHGFKAEEIKTHLLAGLDVGAMNPGNAQAAVSTTLDMLGKIQTAGHLTSFAIRGLRSLGISEQEVTGTLASAYGVKTDAIKKMIEAGQIDAATGIAAIESAIQKKAGGTLGALGEAQGGTLLAVMHKLSAFPESIFETLDTSPAFGQLREFFGNVLSFLTDKKDAIAEGFGKVFSTLTNAIFGNLSGPAGKQKMQAVFDTVIAFLVALPAKVERAVEVFQQLWSVVSIVSDVFMFTFGVAEELGTELGELAGALYLGIEKLMNIGDTIGDFFGKIFVTLGEFGQMVWDKAVNIGTQIWQGLRDGIMGGVAAVSDAVSSLGQGALDNLKGLLGIHSPSKVFEEMGRYSAEGFAKGIANGGGLIDASIDSTMAAPKGLGGSSSNSYSANVELTVNIGGDHEGGEALALRIKDVLSGMLVSTFEQMSIEAGAA